MLLKLICVYRCHCVCVCHCHLHCHCVCVYLVFAAAFIDQSWYFALFCLVCYRIQTSSPLKISFHGWHLFFPFVSFSIKGHQLLLHKETKTFDQIQGKILIYSLFSLICKNQIWSLVFAAWVECRRCGEHLTGEIVRSAKISNFSLTGNLNITFHLHFLSQRIRLPAWVLVQRWSSVNLPFDSRAITSTFTFTCYWNRIVSDNVQVVSNVDVCFDSWLHPFTLKRHGHWPKFTRAWNMQQLLLWECLKRICKKSGL